MNTLKKRNGEKEEDEDEMRMKKL